MSSLPKGWIEVLITDIAAPEKFSIVDGPFGSDLKLTDYVEDGTVPVLTTKNLTGLYDPGTVRFISDKKFDQLKRSKITGGDIIIAKIGSIGKCCIYPEGAPTAIIPANLCKISVDNFLAHNRYLYWQIIADEFQSKLKDITSATAQPAFSVQRLKTLSIPLPPLNEQRRIVAKLDELLSRVDACQQRLAKIPVILKRFRQAVLAAACSGRLTADWREKQGIGEGDELPEGWKVSSVDGVVDGLKYGTSQKCTSEKHGVPVLRIPNIAGGIISHEDLKYADLPRKELQQLSLMLGDILVIRSNGSVSLVGKSALVREPDVGFAYAGYLIRLRPNVSQVKPEYLNLVLGSYQVRLQIEIPARSTSGVNNINSEELRALSFPLPPLPEQQEIVRRVEGLFKLADQLETRYTTAQAQVDKLTQSILAKAFRGELVPQDPSDEPAEKLLERIQEQRKAAPASHTKQKRGGRK